MNTGENMANKRRKRKLKKWVKATVFMMVLFIISTAGWICYGLFMNGMEDAVYSYVYEKPLIRVENSIKFDVTGGIFYKVTKEEERIAVTDKVLMVSDDGQLFHEIRTDENGKLITGWYEGNDGKYYYTRDHGWLVTESGEIEGRYYELASNGRVLDQEWIYKDDGLCYYIDGQIAEAEEDALLFIEGEKGFYYLDHENHSAMVTDAQLTLADGREIILDEKGHIINKVLQDEKGLLCYPVPESFREAEQTEIIPVSSYLPTYAEETLRSVNHRGYHVEAPENSLAAYRLSYSQGFHYVECDIQLTADSIPVLLHNDTINAVARNSDGSMLSEQVYISSLTYQQLLEYDFGAIKGDKYRGMKITTLEEFLAYCKSVGLHPYLELKGETVRTQAQVDSIVAMVDSYGMLGNVTWISFASDPLQMVLNDDPNARLGFLLSAQNSISSVFSTVQNLHNQGYNVFIDALFSASPSLAARCREADIPLELWTVNTESYIRTLDSWVSGITTDTLYVDRILGY